MPQDKAEKPPQSVTVIATLRGFPNPSNAGATMTVPRKLETRWPAGPPTELLAPPLALYGHCVYIEPMAKVKERWDFRVASETDELVRQAAETANRTLTDFVVEAAVVKAERVLADRTQFILDAERWNRFVEILDRSPQDNPGLEKLFSKQSVFTAT